ncbi:hypothetical protein Cde04nite_00960 [Cellulomonas denverensis]|nr:hypothetical protein Cde04nite_00960 [Cellulomonas denverensis]
MVAAALLTVTMLAACSSDDAERDESTGEITEASDASVFSLRVGDCLDYASLGSGDISTAGTIPCDEAHDVEIYAELELPEGDFPGEDAIDEQASQFCYDEFAGFVGLSYEESGLDFMPLQPQQDGWEGADDRIIQCLLVSPSDVTGTLRDSGI